MAQDDRMIMAGDDDRVALMDARSGWKVIAATILFQAATLGIVSYSFTLWVGPLVSALDTGRGAILASISILGVGMALLSPFVGRAADSQSIRLLVSYGLFFVSLGLLLLSVIDRVWQLWIIFAVLFAPGLALAGTLNAQVIAARWFDRQLGFVSGLAALGSSIGALLFPPLLVLLIGWMGWRASFIVLSLVVIATIPCVLRVLHAPPDRGRNAHSRDGAGDAPLPRSQAMLVLREKGFWIVVLSSTLMSVSFSTVQFNLGPIGADLKAPPQIISVAIAGMAGGMVVGKLVAGSLIDRIGAYRTFWLAWLLMGTSVVLFLTERDPSEIPLASIAMGVAMGTVTPLITAFFSHYFSKNLLGTAWGLATPFLFLSSMSPMLAGMSRDLTGSYGATFCVLLAGLAVGGATMAWLPRGEARVWRRQI